MPVLKNPRHELMAQFVAKGLDIKLAARKAGFLSGSAAYTISVNAEFQQRVQELLEAAANDTILEIQEIQQKLTEQAKTDIRELFKFPDNDEEENGFKILPPQQWTNGIASRITGIEFDRYGQPKIKLTDPLKTLELLGRSQAMFKDNVALTGKNDGPIETINTEMTPAQAAELYKTTLGK